MMFRPEERRSHFSVCQQRRSGRTTAECYKTTGSFSMLWSQLLVLCVRVLECVLVCVCKSGPPADKNRENFSGFHRIPTFKHLIIKSKHSSLLFFSQKTHFLFYEATHSKLEKQKPTAAIILCVYRSTEPHPGTSSALITVLLLRRLFIVIFNFYNECSEESRNIKLNVILFSPMTLRSASN